MKFTTITAAAGGAVVAFSSTVLGAPQGQSNDVKRQDDPYLINRSFNSAKVGDNYIQKGIHPDGLWHSIPENQVFIGALREGGADGDLARCFFDDFNTEVPHNEYKPLNPPEGLIGYQICCFYERKSNGIEPDPPRCCHSDECLFMTHQR